MDWKIIKRLDPGTCLRDVVYADGVFVAVGDNGRVETSPDGATWTVRNAGIGNVNLYGVAWGDHRFVAVGQDGYVLMSEDRGATWRVIVHPDDLSLTSVTWDGDRFVATGIAGKCIVSTPDGESWRLIKSGNGSKIESVTSTRRGVLGAGNNGAVGLLVGDTWTWRGLTSVSLRTAAAWGDVWMVGGGASAVSELWVSRDAGVTWDKVEVDGAAYWMGLHYDGGAWVACGDGNVPLDGKKQTFLAHSIDGTTWTRDRAPEYEPGHLEHSTALGIASDGKVVIVCGTRNMIISAATNAPPAPAQRVKYNFTCDGAWLCRANYPDGAVLEQLGVGKFSVQIPGQGGATTYNFPAGTVAEKIQ